MKTEDRSALIRLASSLPKAILSGLSKTSGLGRKVDPAWQVAAERLLEKRKGKSMDDFHYRAYLRAVIAGTTPVTHKDGTPYLGALEARQDLIDEFGKGPVPKNLRAF